jgi:flagellar protein FlaG
MDVSRINGNGYSAPAPPPPPSPGSGEFAPAPPTPLPQESSAPVVTESRGSERAERAERTESRDSLQRAVGEINSSVAIYRRHLGVRFHEPSGRRVVTVYDSDTNEAIREIPPESVLEAHANMLEMVGLFMDTRG